jgi:hypothetical protein
MDPQVYGVGLWVDPWDPIVTTLYMSRVYNFRVRNR